MGRKKLKAAQKSYFDRSQNLFGASRRDLHLLCPSCLRRKRVNGHDLRRRAVPEQERDKQSGQFAGLQPETTQRPLLCSFSATARGTAAYPQTALQSYKPGTGDTRDCGALTLALYVKVGLGRFPRLWIIPDGLRARLLMLRMLVCISGLLVDGFFCERAPCGVTPHMPVTGTSPNREQILVICCCCLQAQPWLTRFPCT